MTPQQGVRPWAVSAAVGVLFTVAVVLVPDVPLATRSDSLQAAVETANGLITLFAALIVYGRLRSNPSLTTGLLMGALLTFSMTSLVLGALPALGSGMSVTCDTWGSTAGRSVAILAFAAAPFAGERPIPLQVPAVAAIAVTLASLAACTGLAEALPPPTVLNGSITTVTDLHVPPTIGLINASAVIAFLLAARGYSRRSGDRLWQGLAGAAVLGAFGRLHQVLVPSLYTGTVYSGDLLRLAFHGAVLLAVVGELTRYWQDREVLAVAEERRRLARDLHDGLAQELSFITTTASALPGAGGDRDVDRIVAASRRALDEARRSIAAMTRPPGESLSDALAEGVEEIRSRTGVDIIGDIQGDLVLAPEEREELLRIAREAMGNAVRHSGAARVTVSLRGPDPLVLAVVDDGCGFDPDGPCGRRGFGLTSMQERAALLGGVLTISSAPGRGASVVLTR